MRDFDFTLDGTRAFVLEAQGTRFFYKTGAEASGKVGVIVTAERGGLQLLLMPGEGVRLPAAAGRWMLTKADPTAAAITGRLIVGDADFTASRVQGDVNVLNQTNELDQIITDGSVKTFCHGRNFIATTEAAFFPVVVRNPVGSGKILCVSTIEQGWSGTLVRPLYPNIGCFREVINVSSALYGFTEVAITSEVDATSTGIYWGSVRYEASLISTPYFGYSGTMAGIDIGPGTKVQRFDPPLIIKPGRGLAFGALAIDVDQHYSAAIRGSVVSQ